MKMKEILKTGSLFLGIVIIMAILVPAALNYILQCSVNIPIVGEGKDWLAFWGAYISGMMTIFVIYQTYRIQKSMKREQIRSLLRSEQVRKIDSLKEIVIGHFELTDSTMISRMPYKIISGQDFMGAARECLLEISERKNKLNNMKLKALLTLYYVEKSKEFSSYIKVLDEVLTYFLYLVFQATFVLKVMVYYKSFPPNTEDVDDINVLLKKMKNEEMPLSEKDEKELDNIIDIIKTRYKKRDPFSLLYMLGNSINHEILRSKRVNLEQVAGELVQKETARIYDLVD